MPQSARSSPLLSLEIFHIKKISLSLSAVFSTSLQEGQNGTLFLTQLRHCYSFEICIGSLGQNEEKEHCNFTSSDFTIKYKLITTNGNFMLKSK